MKKRYSKEEANDLAKLFADKTSEVENFLQEQVDNDVPEETIMQFFMLCMYKINGQDVLETKKFLKRLVNLVESDIEKTDKIRKIFYSKKIKILKASSKQDAINQLKELLDEEMDEEDD